MSSTNKTANLELNQWVGTDPVLMSDFNADNQKIDEAFSASAHTDLRFYTGNGLYGASYARSFTFDFVPKIVFVYEKFTCTPLCVFYQGETTARTGSISNYSYSETVIWSEGGKKLKWYNDSYGAAMLNEDQRKYCCLAIG